MNKLEFNNFFFLTENADYRSNYFWEEYIKLEYPRQGQQKSILACRNRDRIQDLVLVFHLERIQIRIIKCKRILEGSVTTRVVGILKIGFKKDLTLLHWAIVVEMIMTWTFSIYLVNTKLFKIRFDAFNFWLREMRYLMRRAGLDGLTYQDGWCSSHHFNARQN